MADRVTRFVMTRHFKRDAAEKQAERFRATIAVGGRPHRRYIVEKARIGWKVVKIA